MSESDAKWDNFKKTRVTAQTYACLWKIITRILKLVIEFKVNLNWTYHLEQIGCIPASKPEISAWKRINKFVNKMDIV